MTRCRWSKDAADYLLPNGRPCPHSNPDHAATSQPSAKPDSQSMPDLADCQAEADHARYRGRPGYAEYLATRCQTSHHHDDEPRPCTATDHDQETL